VPCVLTWPGPDQAAGLACGSISHMTELTEEGRLRESVLHDGRWYDEVLMSILDHEWAARRSSGQ
jgi:RimJ/RimL family protein N-acetyltransferase